MTVQITGYKESYHKLNKILTKGNKLFPYRPQFSLHLIQKFKVRWFEAFDYISEETSLVYYKLSGT